MSTTATFTLSAADGGWTVATDGVGLRRLGAVPTMLGLLPLPPDGPVLQGPELAAALGRLDRNEVREGDAVAVGRHLLACLVAEETGTGWRDAGTDLRLMLRTTDDAEALQRLPWELLHDGDRFLATRSTPEVTICRQLGPAGAPPRPLVVEPVILVIVGGQLSEAALQPAAEYLALLDTLRRGQLALNVHLLVNANPDDVRFACETFRPDVVHIIAHGDQSGDGSGFIVLEPLKAGDAKAKVNAEQLVTLLEAGRRPEVLVLTACRSGGAGTSAGTGAQPEAFTFRPSLAAACVAKGIPMVAAMTGAVASRACREFTLGFYVALFKGLDVLAASAAGRRAAFATGDPPGRAVDWAYPAVFCGPGVDGSVTIRQHEVMVARAQRAAELLANFRSPRPFCGRHDALDELRKVLAPVGLTDPAVLALCTPDKVPSDTKVGASRALAQLGAAAVLAGYGVGYLAGDRKALPFRQLAGKLEMAARDGASASLTALPESQLRKLLDPALPPLHEVLEERLAFGLERQSDELIGFALCFDLAALSRALLKAPMPARGLVMLVDDLHAYGPAVEPLLARAVSSYGLGTAEQRVPFVFSYDETPDTAESGAIQALRPWVQTGPVVRVPIEPFQPPGAWLAYQQFLLGGDKPLVPCSERRQVVLERIHTYSGGIPDNFGKREVLAVIDAFEAVSALEPAADSEIVARLLGLVP